MNTEFRPRCSHRHLRTAAPRHVPTPPEGDTILLGFTGIVFLDCISFSIHEQNLQNRVQLRLHYVDSIMFRFFSRSFVHKRAHTVRIPLRSPPCLDGVPPHRHTTAGARIAPGMDIWVVSGLGLGLSENGLRANFRKSQT